MDEHPNVERLRRGYDAFSRGDMAALEDLFDEKVMWHVSGRSQVAGDYEGRDAVFGFFGRLMELTGGSMKLEVHDVFANDAHGVVLTMTSASREGKSLNENAVHVYHLRDGKVTEFWSATTDQYSGDEFFGA